jgi:hypothetical protein
MSDTPLTDANEVDLQEVVSVGTMSSGKRYHVTKYIPAYIGRILEVKLAALREKCDTLLADNYSLRAELEKRK